jgi:methyl-accepting chemotaxis protein
LASDVTRATAEQSKAAASIAQGAEDVRRIARQTARALEEQNQTVILLADTATKQTSSIGTLRKGNNEQSIASEQIAEAVNDMRTRIREAVSASTLQAKGVAIFGREMESLSAQIGSLRRANAAQADALSELSGTLDAEASAPTGTA